MVQDMLSKIVGQANLVDDDADGLVPFPTECTTLIQSFCHQIRCSDANFLTIERSTRKPYRNGFRNFRTFPTLPSGAFALTIPFTTVAEAGFVIYQNKGQSLQQQAKAIIEFAATACRTMRGRTVQYATGHSLQAQACFKGLGW